MEKVLKNKNIVLTRAKSQSVETIKHFEKLGANVISFPTIKIDTIRNNKGLNDIINNIHKFNTLIFTSENAVRALMQKIEELNVSFDPKAFFVISIGDRTTHFCTENEFRVDFQPKQSSSESLVKELRFIDLVGRDIFIPTSSLSKHHNFDVLRDYGAKVKCVPVYSNCVNSISDLKSELAQLKKTKIDLFIFTSPSTFNGFVDIMNIENIEKYFKNTNTAVIGPVTKNALNLAGLEPTIIPSNFTMNHLIDEIKKFYSTEKITV